MIHTIFGTDGIRGPVGSQPFTVPSLIRLGQAIACWSQQKYGRNASLLLAHDTRISCSLIKAALKSGLLTYPVQLHDAQILTSPAVFQLIQHQAIYDCGIIISASHNPYQDNGIKLIDAAHGKLAAHDEQSISTLFTDEQSSITYSTLGTDIVLHNAQDTYCSTIIRYFKPNFLQAKKIVLDCAHGAAYQLAPQIFQELGADIIVLNNQPNGININKNAGALYPQALQKAVVDHQADAGFAFDGDADRVIAVNRYGQLKNGDDILALLLEHPLYQATPIIVGTTMTNQGFEVHLNNRNKKLIRTNVGDKYIAEKMLEQNLILGGEQSGHIITRDYLNTGDGIFIALRILEAMQLSHNSDMVTFTKFPQIIINLPITIKKDLQSPTIADIISMGTAQLTAGRLVVRYSGTEPLLRIMIEDIDYDHAQTIGTQLSKRLQQELNSL